MIEKELVKIAKDAGEMLLENFGNSKYSEVLQKKLGYNYSILMDKKTEDFILDSLTNSGLEGKIVTEEFGHTQIGKDTNYTFYIDPLDGTLNYSRSIPHFCISIGVAENGKAIFGIIYDPNQGEVFTAKSDGGAFLNGHKIKIVTKKKSEVAIVSSESQNRIKLFKEGINDKYFWLRESGCTALDFCYTACGRYDATVLCEGSWNVWDIAAGALIAEESGAIVTNFKNKRWSLSDKTFIASRNTQLHKRLLTLVR